MRQLVLVLAGIVIFTAGCTVSGEDRARELAFSDAKKIAREAEVTVFGRPDLGPRSIDYIRSLIKPPDTVLDSWSKPGFATDLIGWIDVAMVRTSTNDTFSSGAQATVCLRFEVRWSDTVTHGDQNSYHEIGCPNSVPTSPR